MANPTADRPRRRRQSKACTRCRKRKIRCDFHYPACGACVAAAAECVGFDSIHGVEKPRSIISHLEDEVARLEQQLREAREAGGGDEADGSLDAAHAAVDRLATRLAAAAATGTAETAATLDFPDSRHHHAASSGALSHNPDKLLLPLTSAFFFAGSPAPHLNKPVAWDETVAGQHGQNAQQTLNALAVQNVQSPPPPAATPSSAPIPISSIPRHVAVIMLKHYCEIYRPQYPAVEEADLLAAFDRVYDNAQPTDFDIFCVHITLAISTTTLMYRDEGRAATATSGFWATAVAHLDHLDQGASHTHAWQRVQALQLLTHYGFLNPKDVDCVRCAAAALRLCVQLGLHHELPAAQQARVDPAVLDVRRRLFWHSYSIDVASNNTRCRPFVMTTADITAQMPHFGPSSPTAHVWALRQMEAEILQRLYYPSLTPSRDDPAAAVSASPLDDDDGGNGPFLGAASSFASSSAASLEPWLADVRARLAAWHQATRQSVALSEKLEFAEIHYHMQRLRLNRPSPRCPAPTAAMRQECLAAAVAVLREFDVSTRLGKLFYIWHAAYCVVEAAVCLLALVLVGMDPAEGEATSCGGGEDSHLSPSDVPILTRHLRMFPGILWKIARRWPAVAHHAAALEGIALSVVDRLQQWPGPGARTTASATATVSKTHETSDAATTMISTASCRQKLKDMSLFCPFPMSEHKLAAHEAQQRARLRGLDSFLGVSDADITAPFDANWTLPQLSPEQVFPPYGNNGIAAAAGAAEGDDAVLDWDFAGVGFEEIFAALIQENADGGEGAVAGGDVVLA